MPAKSIVMAVVLSGWLIASVIAFMIVAYAGFFGVGVVGLMIWFVSTRVDPERGWWVGVGVSPGCSRGSSSEGGDVRCRTRCRSRRQFWSGSRLGFLGISALR